MFQSNVFRCPTYTKIPAGCVLVTPPGEPCCKQVECGGNLYNPAALKPMGPGPKQPTSETQSLGPNRKGFINYLCYF